MGLPKTFLEFIEILFDKGRKDLAIMSRYDSNKNAVIVYRGNFASIIVPLDWFKVNTDVIPNPHKMYITDCGQTLVLGEYEADFTAILYDFDPEYKAWLDEISLILDNHYKKF